MLLSLRSLWEKGEIPAVEGTADATLHVTGTASGTFTPVEIGAVQGGAQAFVSLTAQATGELLPTGTAQAFVGLTAAATGEQSPTGTAAALVEIETAAQATVGVSGFGVAIPKVVVNASGLGAPLDAIEGQGLATIGVVGQADGTAVEQEPEPDLPDTGGFRIRRPGFVAIKRPIRGEAKAKIAAISAVASGAVGAAGYAEIPIEIEASAQGVRGIAGRADGVVVPLVAQAKGEAERWSDEDRRILMLLAEAA